MHIRINIDAILNIRYSNKNNLIIKNKSHTTGNRSLCVAYSSVYFVIIDLDISFLRGIFLLLSNMYYKLIYMKTSWINSGLKPSFISYATVETNEYIFLQTFCVFR